MRHEPLTLLRPSPPAATETDTFRFSVPSPAQPEAAAETVVIQDWPGITSAWLVRTEG